MLYIVWKWEQETTLIPGRRVRMEITVGGSNMFLLVLLLIILIASGNKNSRMLFVILLAILALGADGKLKNLFS